MCFNFFVQAEDGIRGLVRSRGLGDVYKRQDNAHVKVGFKEAVLKGLAPGGGLYVPEMLPHVEATFFDKMYSLSIRDLAYPLLHLFVSDDLSDA